MATAKVFKSGKTQTVRLPKGFREKGDTVEVLRRGTEIVLREIPETLERAFEILASLPEDMFDNGRVDSPPQRRRKQEEPKANLTADER
jgi:antitoxin VapB